MAKDSYWFKHDSTAGRDIKLQEITIIYTHWGKGIYWDVVEVLREQNLYKFEVSKLQMLCRIILCDDFVKFKNWYNDCVRIGLFKEDEKYFYSESLIDRMKNWESKKKNGNKGGRPKTDENNREEIIENEDTKKPNQNRNHNRIKTETITESKPKHKPNQNRIDNRNVTIREEKIREEKIKEECLSFFEIFRKKYPGTKRGLETELENFIKKHKDWGAVCRTLPEVINKQIISRRFKQEKGEFVPAWKNLSTWINNRCWEEEVEEIKKTEPKRVRLENYEFNK